MFDVVVVDDDRPIAELPRGNEIITGLQVRPKNCHVHTRTYILQLSFKLHFNRCRVFGWR